MEVDISAGPTGNGCTICFGGPLALSQGETVTLDNEGVGASQRTLSPGTYSTKNAAITGNFAAWRFDGGNGDWAWNFVIEYKQRRQYSERARRRLGGRAVPEPERGRGRHQCGHLSVRYGSRSARVNRGLFRHADSPPSTTALDFFVVDEMFPTISGASRWRSILSKSSHPRPNRRPGQWCFSALRDWFSQVTAFARAPYDFSNSQVRKRARTNRARSYPTSWIRLLSVWRRAEAARSRGGRLVRTLVALAVGRKARRLLLRPKPLERHGRA